MTSTGLRLMGTASVARSMCSYALRAAAAEIDVALKAAWALVQSIVADIKHRRRRPPQIRARSYRGPDMTTGVARARADWRPR